MKRTDLLLAALIMGLTASADAQQKRIYIANDDHTDFMWSADADTYAHVFVDQLDFHLKLADETAENPAPYRDRFNCDGSYWLWNYEQKKSPAEFDRLMARVKDGTVSAPLNTLVSCYGGQPLEAVLRGMYYSGRLERRYDVRFKLAMAMENQTLPLGLASLFAGAGAEYSWRGVCSCATKLEPKLLANRLREIYWWTGHDGQRLLLKWASQVGPGIGGYWEAGNPAAAINFVETNPGFLKKNSDPKTQKPYEIVGLFGFGGDDLERKTGTQPPPEIAAVPGLQRVVSSSYSDHFHIIAKQQSNEKRQVIVSNEEDFFQDFERSYGATLDTQSVTYGNEWDLYSASMSETTARAKRAVEKLRSAEFLAALVSLKYPAFMKNHQAARDRAFNDLGLFWEHNWTADGPVSRPQRAAWEEEVATGVESYVNSTYGEALIRLGGMIPRAKDANRFFVLNALGWTRNEAADFAYTGSQDIHVRDLTTGQDVPHQIVKISGVSFLRILASEVPSAGYKVYEILTGKGRAPTDEAARITDATFENDAVKLVVERDGAISSFIDKKNGNTELAKNIDGLEINDLAPKSVAGEPLLTQNLGPVSVTIRARSEAGLDHDTFITIYRNSDRVDIRNEINANFGDLRYWTFSFALDQPALHTEEVGVINLNKLQSQGGDYANSHARYDHITVNHFADFTDNIGKRGITISNSDLAFARLGHSSTGILDIGTPQLHMLAGGQVDGRWLGIQGQNGQTHFLQRFALRAHAAYDPVSAMKFALEHQNPLVTGAVISKMENLYPEVTYSFLAVNNPNILLWALKPHEDGIGKGTTARFWNLANVPTKAEVIVSGGIIDAYRTTHIETDLEAVSQTVSGHVPMSFTAQQLQTYRLVFPIPNPN